MFAAPPTIEARTFARIPDRFRQGPPNEAWIRAQRAGAATECFLEGPSFDREGNLYVVDVPRGRILRISPDGRVDIAFEYDGEPNGLAIHRDGRLFIADFRRGILQLDPDLTDLTPVVGRLGVETFRGVNDLTFASNGDLYFTDQGHSGLHDPSGRVFRLTEKGSLEIVLANIPSPNGLALSPDERTLYLNVTRDNAVWRLPFWGSGMPYKVGAFIRLSGGVGPDGLAVDSEGGLAIAHIGLGCVWLFNAYGEPTARIVAPAGRAVTNVAFDPRGAKRLFITEGDSGEVLVAETPVTGHPLFSHH